MKDEYDFSNAEQGRFFRPISELDIPIYLDQEIKDFFIENRKKDNVSFSLNKTINNLIRYDIEISKKLTI